MVVWLGIVLCVVLSATFSGLNLAVFSLGRTHLEAAAERAMQGRRRSWN